MRFARAKGSKASNERVPESATSWQDMKKYLPMKNVENELQTGEPEYMKKTYYNVEKQEKVVKWSEFPFDDQQINKHKLKVKKNEGSGNQKKIGDESESFLESQKKKKRKLQADNSEKPLDIIEPQGNSAVSEKFSGQKEKKRKFQTDNSECYEKPLDNIELQDNSVVSENSSGDQIHKRGKSCKKASKKVRSADCSESKANDSDTGPVLKDEQKASAYNLHKEFNAETNKKQSKKLKQLKKGQKDNVSNTTDIKERKKKSFNKKSNLGEHKRRKPINEVNKIYINGNEIELSYYDGYPIKKIDAERLKALKKEMISRGLPKSEIMIAMKLERRKAEKSLAREKKKVCFNCRKSGHTLSECPALKNGSGEQLSETGICFKCGSTEHTHFECRVTRADNFKFAQCFICKEQGHIARQCPDNNKGLYPKGGACRICGDVTHLKKDCPKYQSEQEEYKIVAHTIDDHNIESLENESKTVGKKQKNSQKIINF